MEIKPLGQRSNIEQEKKLKNKYLSFEKLLSELSKKEVPSEIVAAINRYTEEVNSFSGSNKELRKRIGKSHYAILKLIEKELKLVPKNLYRSRWTAIGMTVFGIPLGLPFAASIGNMGLLGIGIPIGMVIGMAIGAGMDKKALKEGRQLDLDIKY
jgi:hypothetical protein